MFSAFGPSLSQFKWESRSRQDVRLEIRALFYAKNFLWLQWKLLSTFHGEGSMGWAYVFLAIINTSSNFRPSSFKQEWFLDFLQPPGVQSYLVSVPVDANHGFTLDEPKIFLGVQPYMVSVPVEVSHGLTLREPKSSLKAQREYSPVRLVTNCPLLARSLYRINSLITQLPRATSGIIRYYSFPCRKNF